MIGTHSACCIFFFGRIQNPASMSLGVESPSMLRNGNPSNCLFYCSRITFTLGDGQNECHGETFLVHQATLIFALSN